MDLSGIILIVLIIAVVLALIFIVKPLKARKGIDAVGTATDSLKFYFCIGTCVNSKGITRKAIGVKRETDVLYRCVKCTMHNLDYNFSEEQIDYFKSKFDNVSYGEDYFNLIYLNSIVEPLSE